MKGIEARGGDMVSKITEIQSMKSVGSSNEKLEWIVRLLGRYLFHWSCETSVVKRWRASQTSYTTVLKLNEL